MEVLQTSALPLGHVAERCARKTPIAVNLEKVLHIFWKPCHLDRLRKISIHLLSLTGLDQAFRRLKEYYRNIFVHIAISDGLEQVSIARRGIAGSIRTTSGSYSTLAYTLGRLLSYTVYPCVLGTSAVTIKLMMLSSIGITATLVIARGRISRVMSRMATLSDMTLVVSPKVCNQMATSHGFVDLHLHALAHIDDGVKSIAAGVEMVKGLSELGFSELVTTPHRDFRRWHYTDTALNDAFMSLQAAIVDHQIVRLGLGAGMYGGRFHDEVTSGTARTIDGGRCILPEYPKTYATLFPLPFSGGLKGYYPYLRTKGVVRFRTMWMHWLG